MQPADFYRDPAFDNFRRRFAAGDFLFKQDGDDHNLGILVSGRLEVLKDGYLVGVIERPGAIIGEVSLVLGSPHTTSVRVAESAEVAVIPPEHLPALTRKIPEFVMLVMRTLAERLEQTNSRLAALEDNFDALYNRMDSTAVILGKLPDLEEVFAAPPAEPVIEPPAEPRQNASPPWPDFSRPAAPAPRSPLIEREVVCVAHPAAVFPMDSAFRRPKARGPAGYEIFTVRLLRKGCLRFTEDPYGLPDYCGAETGVAELDYALQEVQVCPICLFASNDPSNFLDARAKLESGVFSVRRGIAGKLAADFERRKAIVSALRDPAAFFGPARGVPEAQAAYELGILAAGAFLDFDPAMYANWGFRIVIYRLKLAQIARKYRSGEGEIEQLAEACELLRRHLSRFGGAQYFYAFFLLVALSARLEGKARAEEYFDKFKKLMDKSYGKLEGRLGSLRDEYYNKSRLFLEKF